MSATRTHDTTSASFSAEPMFMSVAIASGKFPIAARQRHGTDRAGLSRPDTIFEFLVAQRKQGPPILRTALAKPQDQSSQ
jgi:hypothetical protein